jgi:hypothetical protein
MSRPAAGGRALSPLRINLILPLHYIPLISPLLRDLPLALENNSSDSWFKVITNGRGRTEAA